MMSKTRRMAISLCAATAFMGASIAPATAQPNLNFQRGLVNVSIGDVTVLENVGVGVAAQVAANVCGLRVGPVAVLGTAVVKRDEAQTICTIDQDGAEAPVTISR